MAKHYTCDICGKLLDKVTSIQDNSGYLYIPCEGTNVDISIHLSIANPAITRSDVCFQCITDVLQKIIRKRKEVIEESEKKSLKI